MKKILFFASALAGLFFAASCQQEEFAPVEESNVVTFEVGIPEVATKAVVDDGTNINDLAYAVYRTAATTKEKAQEANDLQLFYQKNYDQVAFDNGSTTIPIELINDQNYLIVFWAQVNDAWVKGEFDPVKNGNITYPEDMSANNSGLAAFTNVAFLSATEIKGGAIKRGVELQRPFAQINIGTTLPKNVTETVELYKSSVTVTGAGASYNPITKEIVASTAPVEFELAEVPGGKLPVNSTNYEYVAMNYIFANGSVGVAFNIETKKHGTVVTEAIPEVPVQTNYRTNIVGNLLTSEAEYEVIMDADFENPDYVLGQEWKQTGNYTYTINEGASAGAFKAVLDHAVAAAKAEATKAEGPVVKIDLAGDVVWETGAGHGSTPLIPEGSPISAVVINGNGKTFTATGAGVGPIRLANGGQLTFNNVNVVDKSKSYDETAWELTYLEFGGKLAFNGCTFNSGIQFEEAEVVADKCSFISNEDSVYSVWICGNNATFTECTFEGTRGLKAHEDYGSEVATVVVNGCTFGPLTKKPGIALGDLNKETSVTIKNSTFDGCQAGDQSLYMYETDTDITKFTFVTENNTVVPSGDEVIEQGDGVVMVATAAGFVKAIEEAEAGDVIKVAGSVVLPTGVATKPAGELTIEGYTEDAEVAFSSTPGGGDGGLNCYADGMDLIFKNITIVSPNTGSAYTGGFGRAKSVTFENCEYIGQYRAVNAYTKFIECTIDPQTSYIYTDYANVDFTGCIFNCSEGKGVQVYNDGNTTNTVINVTYCTFSAAKHGATWDGKPVTAIDINSNGEVFAVNITNTTATGFPEGLATASTLFNIKGGAEYVTVMIDGSKFISNGLYEDELGNAVVTSQAGLLNALKSGAKNIYLKEGNYELANSTEFVIASDEMVTIEGENKEGCVVTIGSQLRADNKKLTLKNLTTNVPTGLNYTEHSFAWIHYFNQFNMIDCNSNGRIRLNCYNANIEGCNFNVTTSSGFDGYAIFYYGPTNSNVTVKDCAFTTVGKAIVMYNEGSPVLNLDVEDCEFTSSATTDKAAIQMHTEFGISGTLDIVDCTATGFADVNGGLYNELNNNTKVPTNNFKVTINGNTAASNNAALKAAIESGATEVTLMDGNYEFPQVILQGKTLTLVGSKDVVIDVTKIDARNQFVTGATLKFEGVTLNFGKTNYMGFANTASLTYKNCNINGLQFLYGPNVLFEGCSLNSNGAEHSVWTYGAKNVSFTGCDFTYGDRCINCYNDNDIAGGKQTVNFTACSFETENNASEGAVEINSSKFSVGIDVYMDGCTAPAYGQMAFVSRWDSTNGAKTTINIK